MFWHRRFAPRRTPILPALLLSAATCTHAEVCDWTGSSSKSWTTVGNWAGSKVPTADDDVWFHRSTYSNQPSVETVSVKGLIFGDGAATCPLVTLAGTSSASSLTLGADGIEVRAKSGGANITVSTIGLACAQEWKNDSTNLLRIGGNITNGGYALTISGSGNTTLAGTVGAGVAGLTKNGSGTLSLTGSGNNFVGDITINGGTFEFHSDSRLGNTANQLYLNHTGTLILPALSGWARVVNVDTTANANVTFNTTGNVTFANSGTRGIAGGSATATLIKSGDNNLDLSNNNQAVQGTWRIDAGTLSSNTDAGFGAAANGITLNGGTLAWTGNAATPWSTTRTLTLGAGVSNTITTAGGNISIANANQLTGGNLTFNDNGSGGVLLVTANQNYSQLTIANGTYSVDALVNAGAAGTPTRLGSAGNATAVLLGGSTVLATLRFTGTSGQTDRPFTIVGAATARFEVTTGTLTLNSAISESGGVGLFTKSGNGTLVLAANNTYSGQTTVSAGVLELAATKALPGGTNPTGGNSSLNLNGGVLGLGAGNFYRGLGGNTHQFQLGSKGGGFAAYGADRVVLLSNSASTTATWGGTGFNAGATLMFGAADATHMIDFQNPLVLAGATRTIQVTRGSGAVDAQLSGNISGAAGSNLLLTGNGVLRLAGAGSSYVGTTTLRSGTLLLGGNAPSGANGTLGNATSAVVLGDASTAGTDTIALLTDGGYTVARPLTVANYGSGTTLGGNAAGNSTFSGEVTLNRAANVYQAANGITTFSGNITGSGGLTKTGPGTVQLLGNLAYNGATVVSVGTLGLAGAPGTSGVSVADSALLAVGGANRIGRLTLANPSALALASGGILGCEINGQNATNYDQIIFSGGSTASTSGTLNVTFINGFDYTQFAVGTVINLFSLSGPGMTFSGVNIHVPEGPGYGGLAWDTSDLVTGGGHFIKVSTAGVPEPASIALGALAVVPAGLALLRRRRRRR